MRRINSLFGDGGRDLGFDVELASYDGTYYATAKASETFSSINLGAEDPLRYLAIHAACGNGSATGKIDDVTLGGVTINPTIGDINRMAHSYALIHYPTGTSADLVITALGNKRVFAHTVHRLVGHSPLELFDHGSVGSVANVSDVNVDVDEPDFGFVCGLATAFASNGSDYNISNLDRESYEDLDTGEDVCVSSRYGNLAGGTVNYEASIDVGTAARLGMGIMSIRNSVK